jgi:hypothetical protein
LPSRASTGLFRSPLPPTCCHVSWMVTMTDERNGVKSEEVLIVKFRQPSHEFTFGAGMTFVSYPLVLTPLV